jgi:lipopolysaccharide transport system ATP-binding protein
VREYCDRCIFIDAAKVIYDGSPEVAAEKYTKLFNDIDLDVPTQEQSDDRWGDGTAKFSDVKVTVDKEEVVISAKATFKEELEDPIFGFNIKNASGDVLCGTNNKILQLSVGSASVGDVKDVRWSVPNIFGDDTYSIELAITHSDGVTQADWWHDVKKFVIRNDYSTPHPVSPPVQMNIT